MSSHDFVTANILPGKTNALVKNLMKQMRIDDPNEAVRRINAGEWIIVKKKERFLEPMATIGLPACDKFVAAEEFRANLSDIKLWMSERFKEKFLDKIEENVGAAVIRTHKLLRDSQDHEIITELGAAEETTLYCLFMLLMKQADGNGILLTDSRANIFYIRDINGTLRAVYADRRSDDWYLHAYSVGNPDGWSAGNLVVSREDA